MERTARTYKTTPTREMALRMATVKTTIATVVSGNTAA